MTTTIEPNISSYLQAYEDFASRTPHRPAWLTALREQGMARFSATGFPTTRDEEWRYTNTAAIANTAFVLDDAPPAPVTHAALEAFRFGQTAAELVFVDGRYVSALSTVAGHTAGLDVMPLSNAIAQHEALVSDALGKHLDTKADPFAAMNSAFIEDGLFVHVHRKAAIEHPIHVLYVSTGGKTPRVTHPRNLILACPQSQVTIVESYVSLGEGVSFSNAATEIVVGEQAQVHHYLIERENLSSFNVQTLAIHQARNSRCDSHALLLGGALVRNNVNPVLAGEHCECLVNGLYIGGGRQHMDNHMRVVHAQPHGDSRQYYKGILTDQARGVFTGRIIVNPGAQKTDAKQTNANLLLSTEAHVDTKPQLEIYADDVKCTHGATIGQIDEEAIFYLQSRGIGREAARNLLVFAFANESFDRMTAGPVRAYCERLLVARMPHAEMFEDVLI